MIALTERPDGVVIPVRARPGAKKNAVVGERAGSLVVAVSAPAEKGRANDALLDVLADALGCRSSRLDLIVGATARDKAVLVQGLAIDDVRARLDRLLPPETPTERD